MMKNRFRQWATLALSCCLCAPLGAAPLSLQGEWHFRLDPRDQGVTERWFETRLDQKLQLPGSIQDQGIGDDIAPNTAWTGDDWTPRNRKTVLKDPVYSKYNVPGKMKVASWLQPDKHYVGPVWYQRDITLPESPSQEWQLELERTHWFTQVYLDGQLVGRGESLGTPHRFVLKGIKPGRHLLTIRVDNRVLIPVGVNAHSVSDHTQTNWNGLIGQLTIEPLAKARVETLRLTPNYQDQSVRACVEVVKPTSAAANLTLEVLSGDGKPIGVSAKHDISSDQDKIVIDSCLHLGKSAKLWDEHNPNLYYVKATVTSGNETTETTSVFGLREFKANGTQFSINGKPTFLRGTLECCVFPLTGYPAMDEAGWEKLLNKAKEYGLNHIRFHSWCPPEAAFAAADKLGMYLQVECGVWSTVVGDNAQLNQWIIDESNRILREYGNHPSFCMMSHGNEPGGKNVSSYLASLIDLWKKNDSRRVYTSSGGWPYLDNADYWNPMDPRIQVWGAGLNSPINAQPPSFAYDFRNIIKKNMPTVSHEIGQWCVYPDFKEIARYTGSNKAKNFELYQEILQNKGLADLAEPFLFASGRLQTLCYKADIEAALRTPGMAGFQLLGLTDFPGQGTALVGVLNPFWEEKGYVNAAEFREFCNDTVPLVRFPKMTWSNKEDFQVPLEMAHFGKAPLKNAKVEWSLKTATGQTIGFGSRLLDVPLGNAVQAGEISCPLAVLKSPEKLLVDVVVKTSEGKVCGHNTWNIWVYPEESQTVQNPKVCETQFFDQDTQKRLENGETVLLSLKKGTLAPENGGSIAVGFSSIFWNTAWTNMQPPHTLGVYCKPDHPALALFPNDGYSDWQWWDIVHDSHAIVMDSLPRDYRPIVHYIDDWFTNRKLGLLMEMKVGAGKLMVCGADLVKDLDKRPGARQFKASLLRYMASPQFKPTQEIPAETLEKLLPTRQ